MEFWGVEVKPGETVKVNPGEEHYIHISQASLGETNKGNESVPVFLNFNDQKLVIGTLSANKCAQIPYDLVLEKEFELSHSSKNTSIYFCGYKTHAVEEGSEDFDSFDDSESDEDLEQGQKANGKLDVKDVQPKPTAEKSGKPDAASAKAKPKAVEPKKDVKQKVQVDNDEDESDDDDDDYMSDEDDEDSDEEMDGEGDESEDDDSDEEEVTPKKVETDKKLPASASKTPVPEKKAKVVSTKSVQKSGDAGKKGGNVATPQPAKQVGKDKSKQQSPKSAGSTCKSCSKTFASDNALQAHSKAKHGV